MRRATAGRAALATGLRAPKALLPMLFVPELGPAQITELASLLEPVPA